MLAHDWDESGLNIGELAFPIPLNANPFVGPALQVKVLGVYGQVILRLAGNHTGLTPGAPVQVDNHSPFVFSSRTYHLICCPLLIFETKFRHAKSAK
jgi:hypothetical protein